MRRSFYDHLTLQRQDSQLLDIMEIQISVPKGTNMEVVEREYGDIFEDSWGDEDTQQYWLGKSSDETLEEGECEWLDYDEAAEACGFINGAIPESFTMIEGNGGWAQGMISRKDFSDLAATDSEKASWLETSRIYWEAHELGRIAAKNTQQRRKAIFA